MSKTKSIAISKKFEDKDLGFSRLELNLKGSDINHIIVNSIKRIIQTDIPIYAFNEFDITSNSSIFNNNYIKDHIRNIPVWGIENKIDEFIKKKEEEEEYFDENEGIINDDIELDVEKNIDTSALNQLNMYVNFVNSDKDIVAVTTENAEFHYKENLIKSPYKNPIQLVKLQPGQEIKLTAKANLGTEEISGIFSPINVCFFKENDENDYDFITESRGQISEKRILHLSLKLLLKKLKKFGEILPKNSGMEGKIIVENEDHTLGNLISYYMQQHSSVQFFGYNTPHPLKKEINFHYKLNSGNLNNIMKEVLIKCEKIFENIDELIKKF